MSGAAKLTDAQKAQMEFALAVLTRHRAAVDRAETSIREMLEYAEYAEWARQAVARLSELVKTMEREEVRAFLGATDEAPPVQSAVEPSPTPEPRG